MCLDEPKDTNLKNNRMKQFFSSICLTALTLLGNPFQASAEQVTITPAQVTTIWADNVATSEGYEQKGDKVLYDAEATSWICSQSAIANKSFKNNLGNVDKVGFVGSYICILKFDAADFLKDKVLKSATFKFTSKCTVSGKNSNVQVALIGTGWDATTATWNNTNTAEIMNAVAIHDGGDGKGGTNVKTSPVEIPLDVTTYLQEDEDNVIGFAIYTYTGREQQITDISLSIEAVSAAGAADYTIRYVDAEGNELKEATTTTESVGSVPELNDDAKSSFIAANGKKYIYVSDDSKDQVVAADGTTKVNVVFREAETWNYVFNAVDSEGNLLQAGIVKGSAFEADVFNAPYPYLINVDGTIYTTSKQSSDKKGYYLSNYTLDSNDKTTDLVFTASDKTNIVFCAEAENIEGLTLATNGNTAIRSSNGASAYAAEADVKITTLGAGKYVLTTVICDAYSSPSSEWTFLAGTENIFTFTATAVNWFEATSEEFTLTETTDILLGKGGDSKKAVDFIYIQQTEGTPTGISELQNENSDNQPMFNLNGMKVQNTKGLNGLYIQNGKKVIFK